MKCNVCGSPASYLSRALVLEKYDVKYYVCDNCEFIQTEPPYWLSDAYSESIARSDIGLIGRNIKLSDLTSVVIRAFFTSRKKFLDYGGGNGMFVRLMRDKGFDYYWLDKFTKNQFANGFDGDSKESYELLTAFEVFEHLPNPVVGVQEMLTYSRNILFSTRLVPPNRPALQDWWYYTLDTGQHVSLYSPKSLGILAQQLGLNFYSNKISVHIFTEVRLNNFMFRMLTIPLVSTLLAPVFLLGVKSLLGDDYFSITGKQLG